MVCARITRLSARTSRGIKPSYRPKGARRREGRTIVQRQRDSLCVRLTSHKTLAPTLLAFVGTIPRCPALTVIARDVLSDGGPRVAADVARTPVEYAHAEATWRECLLRRIAFGEGGSFAW